MSFVMKPAVGKNFIGRKKVLKRIVNELADKKSANGFALYGKRRVGKTSILLEVKRRIRHKEKIILIYVSVWDLVEWKVDEFCEKIIAETVDAYKDRLGLPMKFEEMIKMPYSTIIGLLKKIELKAEITDLLTLALSFSKEEKKMKTGKMVDKAFTFPEKMAEKTKTKAILMIDEFPSVIELTNGKKAGYGIIGKIRTIHESYERTALCVSGSIMKTMENAILSPSSAFYGQLIPIYIPPLSIEETRELLKKNLRKRINEEGVKTVFELTKGFPLYVHGIGLRLLGEKKIGVKEIKAAFDAFLGEEGTLIFRREFYSYSSRERGIILQLARGLTGVTEIARALGDNPSTIGKLLSYLEEKGGVEKKDGQYRLVDPVFERWVNFYFD